MMSAVMKRVCGYVVAILIIVVMWVALSLAINSPALPLPNTIIEVLADSLDVLLPFFMTSTYRIAVSLLIAITLAVPLAQLFARSKIIDSAFGPFLYILYPIPKVVFLPIFLVLLGLGDASKIALISVTLFFQIALSVRDAVDDVPQSALDSIQICGGSRWDEYRYVILPATLPAIFTSLRVGVGISIAVLFIGEAMAGSTGLGYFIMQSWSMVNYPRMFAGIMSLALLGLGFYTIFDIVERLVSSWKKRD